MREIIEGNYRIIYRIISENEVHILMVHHGARDLIRRI
ncbi:type II toxin-antitoxin system RelE/ParE family toxin [Epilithonimonas sp.]